MKFVTRMPIRYIPTRVIKIPIPGTQYPKENIWSIGLVNGEIKHPENGSRLYNILIIASINPTSGFFILVPHDRVIQLSITVEEAMKWIVSGGIVTPDTFKIEAHQQV
jgi:uncharacterized membrane protein